MSYTPPDPYIFTISNGYVPPDPYIFSIGELDSGVNVGCVFDDYIDDFVSQCNVEIQINVIIEDNEDDFLLEGDVDVYGYYLAENEVDDLITIGFTTTFGELNTYDNQEYLDINGYTVSFSTCIFEDNQDEFTLIGTNSENIINSEILFNNNNLDYFNVSANNPVNILEFNQNIDYFSLESISALSSNISIEDKKDIFISDLEVTILSGITFSEKQNTFSSSGYQDISCYFSSINEKDSLSLSVDVGYLTVGEILVTDNFDIFFSEIDFIIKTEILFGDKLDKFDIASFSNLNTECTFECEKDSFLLVSNEKIDMPSFSFSRCESGLLPTIQTPEDIETLHFEKCIGIEVSESSSLDIQIFQFTRD